jgi:hypothetical protein
MMQESTLSLLAAAPCRGPITSRTCLPLLLSHQWWLVVASSPPPLTSRHGSHTMACESIYQIH